MKIGIVGYQGAGKSSLFTWLTGVAADPAKSHEAQTAMAAVPEPRIDKLCEVYHPKKVTRASLELVDTPGLSRDNEGNAARLGLIREAGCLVMVVAAHSGADPSADINRFGDDLLLADLQIVTGRVERLRESVKKPRPSRDQEIIELAALEPLVELLESGTSLHSIGLSEEQLKATRSFRLLTEKPRLIFLNTSDDEEHPEKLTARFADRGAVLAACLRLELELADLDEAERTELVAEMGLHPSNRDAVLRSILDASGQMLFFTAGEKEVRTWMIHQGGTALEAADGIHSDLARGFIRAEVMPCADLVRLGSERELKAANLVRQEPRDYVIRDGDILNIKFSV